MFRALFLVRFGVIIFIALVVNACTKDIPYDFSNSAKKLIINSTFSKGDRFIVNLNTSRNILDPGSKNENVLGATVSIKDEDGMLLEVLRDPNNIGVYRSSSELTAFTGNIYTLEVFHPDWPGEVYTATSSVPDLSPETEIDTSLTFIDAKPALQIGVQLNDLQQIGDMYVFEVSLDNSSLASIVDFSEEATVYGDQDVPKRLFLDDGEFNGERKNLDFRIREGVPRDSTATFDQLEIRIRNASDELFLYLRSLEEYEAAQNSIGSVNAPAVEIYSNIKQSGRNIGFGIFAGYNEKSLVLK